MRPPGSYCQCYNGKTRVISFFAHTHTKSQQKKLQLLSSYLEIHFEKHAKPSVSYIAIEMAIKLQ